MTHNELFCTHSLLQRAPHFCFWLSSAAMPIFSPIFLILSSLLPSHPVFYCLRHRNKLKYQIVMAQWIYSFCSKVIFVISVRSSIHSDSHGIVSFDNTNVFCLVCSHGAASFPATSAQWSFTKHCCWHRNFQNSTSILHDIQALSSFSFSIAHFCFSFRFAAQDICFH